jgi:hypothetical protein
MTCADHILCGSVSHAALHGLLRSTTKARNLHYRKKHKALLESGQLVADGKPKR